MLSPLVCRLPSRKGAQHVLNSLPKGERHSVFLTMRSWMTDAPSPFGQHLAPEDSTLSHMPSPDRAAGDQSSPGTPLVWPTRPFRDPTFSVAGSVALMGDEYAS